MIRAIAVAVKSIKNATAHKNMNSEVLPGVYRHYKGGEYRVIGVGLHSETMEEVVIYQSQENGAYWVRPKSMFLESVMLDGVSMARFTPLF